MPESYRSRNGDSSGQVFPFSNFPDLMRSCAVQPEIQFLDNRRQDVLTLPSAVIANLKIWCVLHSLQLQPRLDVLLGCFSTMDAFSFWEYTPVIPQTHTTVAYMSMKVYSASLKSWSCGKAQNSTVHVPNVHFIWTAEAILQNKKQHLSNVCMFCL